MLNVFMNTEGTRKVAHIRAPRADAHRRSFIPVEFVGLSAEKLSLARPET
jgi:hypothetical protein